MIVDGAVRLGTRASAYTDTAGREVPYSWRERSVTAALRLPLTRISGQTRESIAFEARVGRTWISGQPVAFRFENNNGTFHPVTWGVTASHVRAAALRDMEPTGAATALVYRHTPLGGDYDGHVAAVRGALYLPGLWRHHALVLDGAHEEQRPGNYRFSREVPFPRGFTGRFHERFTKAGATYELPLWYPDVAFGPWAYVRRVQGNVFADAARGTTRTGTAAVDYRSIGGELTADVAFLGLRNVVRLGVRVSQRLTGPRGAVSEFVLILP